MKIADIMSGAIDIMNECDVEFSREGIVITHVGSSEWRGHDIITLLEIARRQLHHYSKGFPDFKKVIIYFQVDDTKHVLAVNENGKDEWFTIDGYVICVDGKYEAEIL